MIKRIKTSKEGDLKIISHYALLPKNIEANGEIVRIWLEKYHVLYRYTYSHNKQRYSWNRITTSLDIDALTALAVEILKKKLIYTNAPLFL